MKSCRLLLILIFLGTLFNCSLFPSKPGKDKETIRMELLHTDCISALLRISMAGDSASTKNFLLMSKEDTIGEYSYSDIDTAFFVTGLEPGTEYSLIAKPINNDYKSSDSITFVTMETDDKEFEFEFFTFETYYQVYEDAWVFDENNIWAVGRFSYEDEVYNCAKYDGSTWKPYRFLTGDLYDIFSFSKNNIWTTPWFPIQIVNDTVMYKYHLFNEGIIDRALGIYEIFGFSENDIWFAGDSGLVVHYDGQNFYPEYVGTDLKVVDLNGDEQGNLALHAHVNAFGVYQDEVYVRKNGKWKKILFGSGNSDTNIKRV